MCVKQHPIEQKRSGILLLKQQGIQIEIHIYISEGTKNLKKKNRKNGKKNIFHQSNVMESFSKNDNRFLLFFIRRQTTPKINWPVSGAFLCNFSCFLHLLVNLCQIDIHFWSKFRFMLITSASKQWKVMFWNVNVSSSNKKKEKRSSDDSFDYNV